MESAAEYIQPEYLSVSKLWYEVKCDGRPQWKIAALAGFSGPTLSSYIHNKWPIPERHLFSLCDVLEKDPEDLLGTMVVDSVALLSNVFKRT